MAEALGLLAALYAGGVACSLLRQVDDRAFAIHRPRWAWEIVFALWWPMLSVSYLRLAIRRRRLSA